MRVEAITDFKAFCDLEQDWTAVAESAGQTSFFLSHAWFRCCWVGKPEDVRPLILVAREGRTAIGIAPFFLHTSNWRIFPVRAALLMQNQESPFAGLVATPESVDPVAQSFLDYLMRDVGCHVVSLRKIPRPSSTHDVLLTSDFAAPLIRVADGSCPILLLPNDWDEFWHAQSQRFKKTVRNVANRVERLGRVIVEESSASASAEACMQVFASVADRSWKVELPTSLRRNPSIRRFFEALTSELHVTGQLRLWTLRLDEIPIATEYHVHDGDTVYALRSDFDDRYREASPGAYLNDRIIRTYFDRKVRIYDMGPGDNPYKHRWANGAKELDAFFFFRRRPYPMTVYALEQHAVPRVRRARDWWRGDLVATATTGLGADS